MLFAAALASASVFSALVPAPRTGRTLAVEVERAALDPSEPARVRVGALVYRGGLWLH